MAGQAGRGTFFLHIPGPSGPGCRIGAPLALANVGQRPINPIAQAIGLGCMGHIIAACRAAILFLMLMCMRVRGTTADIAGYYLYSAFLWPTTPL
jgi:hypothetical protein